MTPPDEIGSGAREADIALRPGQSIGRYRIEAVSGASAVGPTYRARDTRLGREVTIKEFLPPALACREANGFAMPRTSKVADEFARGRRHFLNEGRILAALQHAPCVVRVLDCIEANETAYIVMEHLQGITLEHRLGEGNRLTQADLDRMLWPLLESLERVHARGVFHGDITPTTIVLDGIGKPTLIDFGAARTPATSASTADYAAPEQISGGKQGPWTDIYGLSATLYHAVVGHPPPAARDRMPEDSCQPLAALGPGGFTPAMLEGIDKGLTLRVADRPQSIAQWRSILWRTGKYGSNAAGRRNEAVPPEAPQAATFRAPHIRASTKGAAGGSTAENPPTHIGRRWLGLAVASVLALGGLTYFLFAIPSAGPTEATAPANPSPTELERQRAARAAQERAEAAARQREEAERQRIEAEKAALHRKMEADLRKRQEAAAAEARRKAAAADPKAAQAAEAALKLTPLDRQHLQAALGGLGFDTRGVDGIFGPRSRQMIAAWQKSRNDPPTGFLTGAQKAALLKNGAAAISAFNERQKKAEETAAKAGNPFDGDYVGTAAISTGDHPVSVRIVAGKGSGRWKIDGCGTASFTLSIKADGAAALDVNGYSLQCEPLSRHYDGQMASNTVQFIFDSSGDPSGSLTLTRQE
jgi:serine/threonine protein kinase/peptidoglycan hydrolase-like protein with peptidoglycan-binding domain